ncbi:hypothetical protein F5051DRAFT_336945, partial [Lentinula edodes]
ARKWFPAAFEYLNQDLGEEYCNLFKEWVEFECSRGWASSTKGLAPHGRPKELSKWILNCRYDRHGNEPELKTDDALVQFSECFMAWWKHLRSPGTGESIGELHKEWGSLDRNGKNGWLSLLACLKWWGMALGGQNDREGTKGQQWRSMVKDASFVLASLTTIRKENE